MLRVLIVDDDEADRVLMSAILARAGHELYFANSGEEAVKLYLRERVDVVVTDIQMPNGDGIELIEALRGLDPDVAIVAVSGQKPHRLQIAELAGAYAILEKPISYERLCDAIAGAALAATKSRAVGEG